jgi:hypothetical protein
MNTDTNLIRTARPEAVHDPVRLRAHNAVVKKIGPWTTARRFDVRASSGVVVLDLLLPRIEAGEIEIQLDLNHAMVKLLVPDGANIDDEDLRRIGRGRVKDWTGTGSPGGRRIRLLGEMRTSEVRVHRGGVAILSLLFSRKHRHEVRQAHQEGRLDYLLNQGRVDRDDHVPTHDRASRCG